MSRRNATSLIVGVLAAAALVGGCTRPEERGPFRNQYIDAETGQPIEGVVFLAVWESVTPTLTGDGGRSFYEAREAVSGPDGRVEIPALTGPIWRLALNVRFHEFASGGYVGDRMQITPSDGQSYVDPTVTFMRRLKTREERCENIRFRMPSVPENTTKIPRYLTVWEAELQSQCQEKGERP